MAARQIRSDEILGLALAIAAHVALLAVLVLRPPAAPLIPPPERMTVTLSEDVGLTSTAPEPAAKPAPEVAPVLGPPPQEIAPAPKPVPAPPPPPVIKPRPLPHVQPSPVPVVKPVPKRLPRVIPSPPPRPVVRQAAPEPPKTAAKVPPMRTNAAPALRAAIQTPPNRPAGASRLGNDFLKGIPAAQATGTARTPPAAAIGPAVQSALAGAISRQLKPRWVAPQGVDAEKLVTVLSWNLNDDGTLAGRPVVVRQEGINDANRPQAARHAEQAIRAVQLAAPFNLPPEYYDAWKRVASFRFDRRLSQ